MQNSCSECINFEFRSESVSLNHEDSKLFVKSQVRNQEAKGFIIIFGVKSNKSTKLSCIAVVMRRSWNYSFNLCQTIIGIHVLSCFTHHSRIWLHVCLENDPLVNVVFFFLALCLKLIPCFCAMSGNYGQQTGYYNFLLLSEFKFCTCTSTYTKIVESG